MLFIGQPAAKSLHLQGASCLPFLHTWLNEFLQQLCNGLFFQPRKDPHLVDIACGKLKRNRDLLAFLFPVGRPLGIRKDQIRKESAHAYSAPGTVFGDRLFFFLRNAGDQIVAPWSADLRPRYCIRAGFIDRFLACGRAGISPDSGGEVFPD